MKKGLSAFIFIFFIFTARVYSASESVKKVLILKNEYSTLLDESTVINELCSKYLSQYSFSFSTQKLQGFDINALFQQNSILARKLSKVDGYNYVIIPSSLTVDNNLTRARLIIYDGEAQKFYTLYDKLISSQDAQKHIEDNIVKIFSYLGLGEIGVLRLPQKQFGYDVYIDGKLSEDGDALTKGEHDVLIISEGYENYKSKIDIKPSEYNILEFELEKKKHKGLLISTDNLPYNAISSDVGTFNLPHFLEEYTTPSSISFSYPGFETKYINLSKQSQEINISLKPSFLSSEQYYKSGMKDFYSVVVLTLSAFALDITSRSFTNEHPNSLFWRQLQVTSSNIAYFSLTVLAYKLIDYFFSSVYAFE